MSEKQLRVLKPVEPVAQCGRCGNPVYIDGKCQSAFPQPGDCCLRGEEWRLIKMAHDMRNCATICGND
jgi:hypothetical protein